jgi:protein tyrosine phosphatase
MFVRTKNGDTVETYRIKLVLVDHDCSQGISFTQQI